MPIRCLRANAEISGWRRLLGVAALNRCAELQDPGRKLKYQIIDTVTNLPIDDLCLAGTEHGAPSGKLPSAGGGGFVLIDVDPGLRGPIRPPELHPDFGKRKRVDSLRHRAGTV